MFNLEYQKLNDTLLNFCNIEYDSKARYLDKQIKSSNIFNNSIYNTMYENKLNSLFNRLDSDKTCWGIKNVNGNIEWELYFYSLPNKFQDLRNTINPFFNLPDFEVQPPPYFMWSFDINNLNSNKIEIYITNNHFDKQSFIFSGSSYTYDSMNYTYGNTYHFWKNPIQNLNRIKDTIFHSPFIDRNINIESILIPEFIDFYRDNEFIYNICTTKKRNCDSLYYMSLDINMLIVFLKKFNYPINQIEFLEYNKNKLNHLLYDISINYKVENGKLKIIKSGYYGQI